MAKVNPKTVNIWTARFIPVLLMGIVGYATYVLVVRLCINYLLQDNNWRAGRVIALLIIYFLLFLPMSISYFRLLLIVTFDPGFVPLGKVPQRPESRRRKVRARDDKTTLSRQYEPPENEADWHTDSDAPGLEEFYTKDVFVCEQDGRPKWCTECANWKPDRSHHCSDVGRCVRKMDHFCPWVGGVVAENSFKFFIQFVTYTAMYCFFLLVVMAYYVHEQISIPGLELDPQFAAILGLAAFFGLFTFGMTCSSVQFAISNLTTVENLNKKTKVWQLAVYLPDPERAMSVDPSGIPYSTVTYPLPHVSKKPISVSAPSDPLNGEALQSGGVHTGPHHLSERDAKAKRTFGILRMAPGQSPWDLGAMGNWKSVMGNNPLDWFLPINRSPCCNHESTMSQFALGAYFERLLADHGLISEDGIRSHVPFRGRLLKKHSRQRSTDVKMHELNQSGSESQADVR